MKETTTTKSYDFTEANDFLRDEVQSSPEQLYDEIVAAMHDVASIENRRNHNRVNSVWNTLLTCADFFERINRKEAAI